MQQHQWQSAAAAEGEHCILVWHDNTETQLVMVDRNSVYTSSHACTFITIYGSCKDTITIEVLPPVVTECTLP